MENKRVTSHPSEKAVFTSAVYEESSVVKDGNIITSRGVGTTIDFALELIGEIKGIDAKLETANKILWELKK